MESRYYLDTQDVVNLHQAQLKHFGGVPGGGYHVYNGSRVCTWRAISGFGGNNVQEGVTGDPGFVGEGAMGLLGDRRCSKGSRHDEHWVRSIWAIPGSS